MTMLDLIRPVQQLQPSLTFNLILFHIRHTHHTSPQVITTLPLEEAMGGKKFRSNEELHQVAHEWLHTRPQEFFSRGIRAFPVHWRNCVERQGDCVEK
jgi:hypothetical protein